MTFIGIHLIGYVQISHLPDFEAERRASRIISGPMNIWTWNPTILKNEAY
jgi:hypothetical protein